MPIASHLAAESVRRQFSPDDGREYVYDPIRFPHFVGVRSLLARALRTVASVVEPRSYLQVPAPRLDSAVCPR